MAWIREPDAVRKQHGAPTASPSRPHPDTQANVGCWRRPRWPGPLLVWRGPPRHAAPTPQHASQQTARVAPRPALHPVRAETQRPADTPEPAPQAPAPPTTPDASDAAAAPQPTTPSGIHLFPPPGTDPPKRGLVVPDDFPLPEGYVRHYQATDNGEPLPAILMFHPDYVWLDDAGNPVEVPDGVVPPSWPEGMRSRRWRSRSRAATRHRRPDRPPHCIGLAGALAAARRSDSTRASSASTS